MQEARLSVRVDEDVKRRAQNVFRELGLTMSAGINLYLTQVALQRSVPFFLTQIPQEVPGNTELRKQAEELKAQKAISSKIQVMRDSGAPVALYDDQLKRPYLEYPDGQRDIEHLLEE